MLRASISLGGVRFAVLQQGVDLLITPMNNLGVMPLSPPPFYTVASTQRSKTSIPPPPPKTKYLHCPKIDRPVAALLNAAFGVWGYSAGFLQHPTWGAAATVASVASLSLGTTVLVAVAAFFLPVTVALVAAAATLALPAAAVGWVVACTRPACEQLWRPMLVWVGTRSGLMRRVLLFPLDQGGHAEELGGEVYGVLVGEEAAVVEGAGEEPVSLMDVRGGGDCDTAERYIVVAS